MFGSRRGATNRNKTEINCIAASMNELGETGERPRLVEMSYVSLNHTTCLMASGRPEELVVTIDETLEQQPPDTPSGT